jgi:hypothetical protein
VSEKHHGKFRVKCGSAANLACAKSSSGGVFGGRNLPFVRLKALSNMGFTDLANMKMLHRSETQN